MTVRSVTKDPRQLTISFVAQFDAPPERVWQVWADPRQLERWWGPPTWPATFVTHDLAVGAKVHYFMTGPGGEQEHGWWTIVGSEPPYSLVFDDGFADASGARNPDLPTIRATVTLEAIGPGTRMTVVSSFADLKQMEAVESMGMELGMTQAMGQIDNLLAG